MADKREFVKLDIGYLSNPKVAGLLIDRRPLAVLLHVECMTYSRQHRTDGIVPAAMALRGVIGATKKDLAAAVAAGLLIDHGDHVEVHDYLDHQESAADIKARSDAGRTGAQARWAKARGNANRTTNGNANRIANSNAEERRGEKRTTTPSPAAPATARATAADFDQFWTTYPRKVGKDAARRAFAKAARTVGPDTIINGARRLADDPNLPEKQYIPHPATWLNRGGWDDEPLPPRLDRPTDGPRPGTSVWDLRAGGDR